MKKEESIPEIAEKKGDKEIDKEGYKEYRAFTKRKKGKISEFFNHLVAYGGFNFNEGVMKIWGDPSIFFTMDSFVKGFIYLRENLDKDLTHKIYYWLGKLYGYNSSVMLMKKFGFNPKDLPDFVNGATQDGFGYVEIIKYAPTKEGKIVGEIRGENSRFALKFKSLENSKKECIDYYLLGILNGGASPLFNKEFVGKEKKCIAKGDKNCFYVLTSINKHEEFDFFKNTTIKQYEIESITKKLGLIRKSSFKLLGKKEIKFGDGSFIFKGVEGVIIPSYGTIILEQIIFDLGGDKLLLNFQKNLAKENIESIKISKKSLSISEILELLKKLELFCLGNFEIKLASKKKLLIKNTNNPRVGDSRFIFKKYPSFLGRFEAEIISSGIEKTFGKKIKNYKTYIKNNVLLIEINF
jgi:predicted hydrocarbon binding protein